jgi:hypothetical protein
VQGVNIWLYIKLLESIVDLTTAFVFVTFVALNSFFSYRAGEKSGKYDGMLMGFRFLKDKNALRDKNKVIGFANWPMPLQQMYIDPDHVEIED